MPWIRPETIFSPSRALRPNKVDKTRAPILDPSQRGTRSPCRPPPPSLTFEAMEGGSKEYAWSHAAIPPAWLLSRSHPCTVFSSMPFQDEAVGSGPRTIGSRLRQADNTWWLISPLHAGDCFKQLATGSANRRSLDETRIWLEVSLPQITVPCESGNAFDIIVRFAGEGGGRKRTPG
jgi:hypothetical protein